MRSGNILLIDGQVFQTDARDRGMGRYSACLIKSLLKQNCYASVRIIANKNTHTKRSRDDLGKIFKGAEIVYLNLANTVRSRIELAITHNKKEVNDYISSITDDKHSVDYLIPCPFQEPVVSIFPDGVKKMLVFYDLIPYLYCNRYQPLMQFDNYLKRFSLLFEADKILSISQSVRDDLIVYLGIPGDRVVAIDGAAIKSDERPTKPKGFDIPDKYILMPTSDDPRKNNLRAVLGFEEFRSGQSDDYKLVITSKIHKSERGRLETFSSNLLFTGSVGEPELDWLYSKCQAVLFVPESEGLGLPILEAVLVNKRVICSSLNVFKEISEDAFYYCDHENQYSISDAIKLALATSDRSIPKAKYQSILRHYDWDQTAKRLIRTIGDTVPRVAHKRPKIAMFIPAPDGLSAIGKVVAEGYPVMNEYFDIDYYAEHVLNHKSTRPNHLQYSANYYPAESFSVEKYKQYDAVVYHIGNSDYHVESIRNCLYLPGYVILHDTNIGEAYRIMYEKGMISEGRRNLEGLITKKSLATTSSYLSSVMNHQLGVLTHSRYAASASKDVLINDNTPIVCGNLATQCSSAIQHRSYNHLTVGLAGIIADVKGIEVIELLAKNPILGSCDFKLFGYNYATSETIDRLNQYANIVVTTNLTDFDFYSSMGKLDVFVNYRLKYQGETSLSTLEAMRQGVVVIVRNVGWYSELPDDVVIKVDSEEEVIGKLIELKSNLDELTNISNRAKQYVLDNHNHEGYAERLMDLIKNTDRTESAMRRVVDSLKDGSVKTPSQLLDLDQPERYESR